MSTQPSELSLRDRVTDLGGIFFPVGYVVAAFADGGHAGQVRRDLRAGGYEEADCRLFTSGEVAEAARQNLEQHTSLISQLGRSDDALRLHLATANKGASFLLVYAASDTEAARVMNVIRRVPFEFAHRYHRFVIEELE